MLNADSDEIENCTVRRVMGIFNVKLWKFCKAINNICATKQERRSKTVDLVQRPGCSEFAEYAFCRREIWFVYSIPNCSTLLHSFKVHSPFLLLTCPVCWPHLHFFSPPWSPVRRPLPNGTTSTYEFEFDQKATRSSGWLARFDSVVSQRTRERKRERTLCG